jgi:hypothetical protein
MNERWPLHIAMLFWLALALVGWTAILWAIF